MANTKIVLNRQSDLILDNALITNPQGIVLTDISGVSEAVASINTSTSTDISVETSSRVAGDLSLSTDLSTEVSRAESSEYSIKDGLSQVLNTESSNRVSSDLSLQNQINFITNNSDAAAIDSLTEVVAAFQSADGDLNGAITNLANAATVDLSAEISNRVSGDESLTSDLSAEISERQQGINELYDTFSGDLSAEISNRIADVDAELSRAESAEASLDVAKLNLAGGTMSGGIDMGGNNITNANAFIGHGVQIDTLYGNANTVMFGVEALDFQNTNKVINLPAPTNDGDATNKLYVDTALSTELSDRVAGDESLQNQIDFITNNTDAAAIDSLTEVVAAFQSADGDLNGAITNLANAATTDLSAEIARAESAEASLSLLTLGLHDEQGNRITSELSTELSRAESAEASLRLLTLGLHDEQGNRITSELSTELSRAESAEASLRLLTLGLHDEQGQRITNELSTELSARVSGDLSLQNQIDFITNNTDAAAIDSLTEIVSAFQSADGDINNAITNLANAATTDLSSEVSRAESAEASLDVAKLNLAGGTMSGDIEMNGNDINNVEAIRTNAVILNAFEGVNGDFIVSWSHINMRDENKITGLAAPTNDGDATNKLYVDSALSAEVSRAESAELSIVDMLGADLTADLSTEASDRLLGDEYLQSQLNDLAQTDGLTLDVDTSNNTIKLKDTVAAPLAGIRTFEGLINVGSQPSNDGAFGDLSLVTKKFVEDADASIMSIVNNVITNIDPSALDSLTEIVAAFQSADNDLNGTITNLSNAATTDLNTEVDARISSITSIDDMIDALPLTDGQTIDVNIVDNTIELKETVAAPDSGIRTFLGEVDVETVLKVAGVDVMATLSSEVSRAESAEASIAEELSSEVSYIMANTDLSSIDSFAEVVADLSSEVSRAESAELSLATDFTNIYAKHVAVTETPDGSVTSFTLASPVREGSELIYLNGLSLDSEDYTANVTSGMVVGVTFITAPSTGDKVRAYGVY